jgi:hypothetical protein
MKSVMAIIGVIIILALFGTMMMGLNAAKTDERTDTFAAVATGMAATTADVVLVTDIFNNSLLSVVSITSDNVGDAPLPDVYTAGSNTLTVRGLKANDTRALTVVYDYDALTGESAPASTVLNIVPIIIVIALLLIIVGAAIAAFARR